MPDKKRVAILGGGVGGLSAAFALTSQPGWQTQYDVTVYQMGWRLGGKGASGRRGNRYDRIEEHGLHIWMGCYENAFRLMQQCYAELGRPAGAPLARWDDAFKKHNLVTIYEKVNNRWLRWDTFFPPNDDVPGQGGCCLNPWNMLLRMLDWMRRRHTEGPTGPAAADATPPDQPLPAAHLCSAAERAACLAPVPELHSTFDHMMILGHVEQFRQELTQALDDLVLRNDSIRRDWILLTLCGTVVAGMLRDGLWHTGFDPADRYEFRAWLRRHGAPDLTVNSAPVQALYDLVFAYEGGDLKKPNLAAGVALRAFFRTAMQYQGAYAYKMQAGMGDVVFTPLYQVLKKRGVRFQFFHRVEALKLADDKRSVAAIEIAVQATLKPGQSEYEPLVAVKGLDCWPSEPKYDQLVEGKELQNLVAQGYEPLESAWSPWQPVKSLTLRAGEEGGFDLVVLGIPVGALKRVCADLMQSNRRWADMVQNVQTVQTLGFQLWLNKDAAGLGWVGAERALLGAYLQSSSDMSQVIPRESWPPQLSVQNIAYCCNVLPDAPNIPPPFTDPVFPATQQDRVKQAALDFLTGGGAVTLWPHAADPNNPAQLDWSLLVDPDGGQGAARFDTQFWRANIDPNERYVLSVTDSTRYRLRAGESGYANLYLAGDWVLTGLNAGCVEAAVMAGLQASRAICGRPHEVWGETDFCGGWWGARSAVAVAAATVTAAPAASAGGPLYVDRGGEQVYAQPISFQNVRFYSFLLPADQGALQALCDRYLNGPAGGQVCYRPLLPRVVLGVAVIGRAQPAEGLGSQIGWVKETDVAFWVPLVALHDRGGGLLPAHLAWFQPYLFVDHPWAAMAGREIYGFAKALARVGVPADRDQEALFTVHTPAAPRLDPQAEVDWQELLRVYRGDQPGGMAPAQTWDELPGAFRHFVSVLTAGKGVVKLAEEVPSLALSMFLNPREVPLLFLKQFRDVADGGRACYQAVVEAPARVVNFQGAGFLDGQYRLRVGQYVTHPVVQELGLAGAEQDVLGAWYLDFSFVMGTGREVWKAAPGGATG